MGIGTVPPYMTSTLPGFNRQRSPFPPPNADHYFQKQSFPAASPLPSAAANGSGVDEEGSDGSGSYIEMDELSLGPGENQKKRYSKRRRSTKSSQKHSDQHSGQRAATTPHGNALVSSLLPSHQATPYLQPSFTLKSMRQVEQAVSDSFIPSSPEMTLGEFVSKHQHEFPVRVRVSRGFYGTTDRWSISEGELFNIHFVKYTKVVATTDGGSGHYYIPINSAVEFASLYAPNDEVEAGLKGFSFKTARDITSQRTMPQIVRATASCIRPGSPEASVNANELLVLKKVKRPFFGSPVLHCVNPLTGEKKILPATSTGHFSTNPFQVRLFLPEVIQHLTFPGQFVMFINPDMNCDLPDDLFTRPITLSHCSIETSLVATQQESTTTNDPRDHVLLEIPIDLDIGVELVKPRAEEMAQLFEDTQDIYDNFDVSHLKVIPSNAASSDLNPDVTKAVTTIRRGKGNVGVHLQQSLRYSTAVGGGYSQPLELFTPIQKMKQGNNSKSHSVSEDERMATLESQVCQMAEQIKGQIKQWYDRYCL